MNCNGVVETFLYLFSSDPAIPSLLYYTHIPVAIITLILGFFGLGGTGGGVLLTIYGNSFP